jgi:hypothetical protein
MAISRSFHGSRRHRLTVRTCGSHPHNRGSIPRGDAIFQVSVTGREEEVGLPF